MRRAWTLSLVVALVALATLGASSATAKQPFYGVHYAAGPISKPDLNRLDQGRVGTVRRMFYWPALQPRKGGKPNWTTDKVVGNLAARGVEVLPFVYGSPRYVAKHPNVPPVKTAKRRKLFRKFMVKLVKRYGKGGGYWTVAAGSTLSPYHRDHPGKPNRPITAWQIWNEPNLKKFFAPHPSVGQYAKLVRTARGAIHGVDRKRERGPRRDVRQGPPIRQEVPQPLLPRPPDQALLRCRLRQPVCAPRAAGAQEDQADPGGHEAPSAMGAPPSGSPRSAGDRIAPDRFGLNKGLRGQKRILQKSFRMIVRHRRGWHVKRLIWFNFRDPPAGAGGCSFCTSAGLLKRSGNPKPAWRAFKRFTHR